MGVEDNKKMVLEVISCLSDKRVEDAFKLFAPNATWWYPHSLPGGGVDIPIEIMKQIMPSFFAPLRGFKLKPVGITAEGDRVAVEVAGEATTQDGVPYNNTYHMAYLIEDGKITAVREYSDTLLISKILPADVEQLIT